MSNLPPPPPPPPPPGRSNGSRGPGPGPGSLNNLKDIRWVYEDAFKFVRREAKRGNKYNGIIMDPPPYGWIEGEK